MLTPESQKALDRLGLNEWLISDELGEIYAEIRELKENKTGPLKLFDAVSGIKANIWKIEKELIRWEENNFSNNK
jgi:hypothetical protein